MNIGILVAKLLDNVSGFVVPGKLTALQESQEQGRPTKCIPLEPSNSSDGTNTYRRLLQTRSSLTHLLEPTQKAVLASDSIKLASPDPESRILSTLSPSLRSPVLVRLNVLACPLIFKISLSRRCFRSLPKCKRIVIAVVRRLSGDAGRWRRRLRAIQEQGRPAKKDRGSKLKKGANVHCYDNHRVAMAFSVLASVIPDTILEEKRCVEKTWPNWWDDLQNKIGLEVKGVELSTASVSPSTPFASSKSVVLIGMRGSGKTFIGELAATGLQWTFIDADNYFETANEIGVRQFVHDNGWPAFREAEIKLLKGIVETPAARDLLKNWVSSGGIVVHVARNIEEIIEYLGLEGSRPAYGEPVSEVFKRRTPWFAECSSHRFINHVEAFAEGKMVVDPADTKRGVRQEVARFFNHITGVLVNLSQNLTPGRRSYFLSLTYPDIMLALPAIEDLSAGVDALEVRVDLLRSKEEVDSQGNHIPSQAYVADQISALRRVTSPPLIFTVRTVSEGGAFPDHTTAETSFVDYTPFLTHLDVLLSIYEKPIPAKQRQTRGHVSPPNARSSTPSPEHDEHTPAPVSDASRSSEQSTNPTNPTVTSSASNGFPLNVTPTQVIQPLPPTASIPLPSYSGPSDWRTDSILRSLSIIVGRMHKAELQSSTLLSKTVGVNGTAAAINGINGRNSNKGSDTTYETAYDSVPPPHSVHFMGPNPDANTSETNSDPSISTLNGHGEVPIDGLNGISLYGEAGQFEDYSQYTQWYSSTYQYGRKPRPANILFYRQLDAATSMSN
ncbi:shikimate kinase-domain-containing protein [Lentinula raphanica]|nr:shikimate kinase-domain-containing protein [Lentinula raphanica]